MRVEVLDHEFVEFIPALLEDGVIYISIPYATAVHKCCCGCGEKVITPISPTDWHLTFDGETISLSPSIGNWTYSCQSHYWIRNNRIKWAPRWSKEQIERGRRLEQSEKDRWYDERATVARPADLDEAQSVELAPKGFGTRIRSWIRRAF